MDIDSNMQGKCDKNQRLASVVGALILMVCSCTGQRSPKEDAKPLVVVSIVPQAYFVKRMAGELVRVETMIPPGASPATYEPSINQMASLSEAKLYIKVGHENFPFEKAWLDKLLTQTSGAEVLSSAEGITSVDGDPHIWASFKQAGKIVSNIATGLKKVIPNKALEIEANRMALQKEIDEADGLYQNAFKGLEGKKFYVFHSAWTYLANDYGLEQVVLEHGHKEPTPHHVQHVIEGAKASGAKTIFAQPQMSKESADMVAREIGGRVIVIDPLAEDWLEGMKQAAKSIREALAQ